MHDQSRVGFCPLSRRHVDQFIPASPGSFTLAVRLANGAHHAFFTAESGDLQESLRSISHGDLSGFPPYLIEYLERFQCYLSYECFPDPGRPVEPESILRPVGDPITRLRTFCAN